MRCLEHYKTIRQARGQVGIGHLSGIKALPKGPGNNHLKPLACLQRHNFCKPTSELGAKFLIISWHLMDMAKEKDDQCLSEFVWAQACKIRKA